jgi:hypothetical protein
MEGGFINGYGMAETRETEYQDNTNCIDKRGTTIPVPSKWDNCIAKPFS